MFRKKDAEVYYINERSRSASEELASLFSYCIQKDGRMFRELVFLCIGSDRITGDSLGPLIGYQLSPYCSRVFHVYGTLDDPVHALNLPDRISYIHSRHPEALLVAIDASLGSRRHQGYITIGIVSRGAHFLFQKAANKPRLTNRMAAGMAIDISTWAASPSDIMPM